MLGLAVSIVQVLEPLRPLRSTWVSPTRKVRNQMKNRSSQHHVVRVAMLESYELRIKPCLRSC